MVRDRSNERPQVVKIGSLQGYLPLSDTTVTTRGQILPGLIRERSSLNIEDIKKRRRIRIEDENEDDGGDLESNADSVGSRRDGLNSSSCHESPQKRRLSALSDMEQVLNTPHMRSMRLIGKPNPLYQCT